MTAHRRDLPDPGDVSGLALALPLAGRLPAPVGPGFGPSRRRPARAGGAWSGPGYPAAGHPAAGHPAAGQPATEGRPRAYRAAGKRAFDLAAVLAMLPAVLPLVLLLALLVAMGGGRPFYRQARLGRGGREFRMWKLRSMVPDAEARLEAHLRASPDARAEWDRTQKLKDDPRVTRFGRLLRKASLDELPQLWNVLKGDMSLVGPRPMMTEQRALYPGMAYFRLRPGITGPWQVSERNQSSFADRARFDAEYDRRLSFGTDLALLVATVRTVLRATGY